MFNFWWLAEWSKQKTVNQNPKKWKRPPKSLKNEMFIFGLRSTSDDRPSDPSKKCWPKHKKNKKGPISHWKIKCLFLDYIQLLMIGQAIQAKNVDWNVKKQKRPPKLSKNKMFIFGLHSTSDDKLSDPSKNVNRNAKKWKCPLRQWKINVHFWITFNFWWSAERSEQKTSTKTQQTKKAP